MRIARLHPHEGPRFRSIRLRALRDAPDAFGSTYTETAARAPEVWTAQLEALATFVAVDPPHDVGMVRASLDPDDPQTAWLYSMWVQPSARGRGVGQALVEKVIDWAGGTKATCLKLEVVVENESANRLYARLGFSPTGREHPLPPPRAHLREHELQLRLR